MNFEFHPDALREYQEASLWYEEQRFRLGLEFSDAVESAVTAILTDPERFQAVGEGVQVFRLKRFPYYIFYRYDARGSRIRILAVMHHRRRPDYWRQRV